jgi:LmbE family N-acetylglucosaminyl deacetylase
MGTVSSANFIVDIAPSRFAAHIAATPLIEIDTLIPSGRRIVIVAPHPDDEVLGCGGLLAALAERNNAVLLIAVTDGEACYPLASKSMALRISKQRCAETVEALRRLRLPAIGIIRLGLPDGKLNECDTLLATRLRRHLQADDIVITTWRHDGHCDHETVGHVVATTVASVGATLIEVPIWAWHLPSAATELIPWCTARCVSLRARWQLRKAHAINAYVSQLRAPATLDIEPILSPALLSSCLQRWEMVFT